MGYLPKARTEHLVTERVGDELVIYDQVSHVAHCLAPEAVAVWECCDGDRTVEEIAHQLVVSQAVVEHAVAALAEQKLLEQDLGHLPVYSRRQAAAKLAKAGRVAFVASLIYSVDVGTAAAAASHLAAGCIVLACSSSGDLCGTEGLTGTNSACASSWCYCTFPGGSLRCATEKGRANPGPGPGNCRGDTINCSLDRQCCGNRCLPGSGTGQGCQPALVNPC